MTYRSPPPRVELPAAGVTVGRASLSPGLRERLERLARLHAEGRTTLRDEGQALIVTFPDGTIWFPQGIEKDNPAIIPVLGFGLGALALAALSVGALDDPDTYPFPFLMMGGAAVSVAMAMRYWRLNRRLHDAAVRELAMGTLLMEDGVALLAYDEVTVLPKERVTGFELVEQRSSERRSARLHATFVTDDGETTRRYLGFLFGSDRQHAETLRARGVLEAWLEDEEE